MAFTQFGRTIKKIGVIGSGNIGPDIALHFSQNLYSYGVPVVVVDILQAALDSGAKKAESKVNKTVEKKIYKKEEGDAIFRNMIFTTDYGKLSDADLVIEAAFERTDVKHKIFAQLEQTCSKTAILASNSSHITPEEIFANMKDKTRCLVLHYFFPAAPNRPSLLEKLDFTLMENFSFLKRFGSAVVMILKKNESSNDKQLH